MRQRKQWVQVAGIAVFLVFITVVTTIVWQQRTKSAGSAATAESAFAVENTDAINKIFIADRSGRTVLLTRSPTNPNIWLLNEKYKARPQAIDNLLKTIRDVKVRYVIPQAGVANAVAELATRGIKVEIFNKKSPEKPFKTYYVGSTSADGLGTNIIMEGSDQPYVVHIPLWEGVLTPRFMTQEVDWRDKTVFEERWEDIRAVSVEYPKQQDFSFKLTKNTKNNRYEVAPFYPTTATANIPLNSAKVQNYLIGFSKLVAEAIQNDHPRKQEVLGKWIPFCTVSVVLENGTKKMTTFYPIDESFDQSGTAATPFSDDTIERFHVWFQHGDQADFLLGQYRVFMPIFRGYGYFFGE